MPARPPHSLTHSPTHLLTYSPTHPPTHSLTHSLTHTLPPAILLSPSHPPLRPAPLCPPGTGLDLANTNTHIANTVYCVLEICFTAIPVRLLHFYQSSLFAIGYVLFTLAYWKAGGIGIHGEPYVYSIFDYGNKPLASLKWFWTLLALNIILHCVIFSIILLRRFVFGRCRQRNKVVPCCNAGEELDPV